MTFSVKQYVADTGLEPYVFEDADGAQQTLPNMMLLSGKQADAFVSKLETDPLAAFAELAPDMADIILAIPVVAVGPLVDDYVAHCKGGKGDAVGESEASPGSSTSTARQSKPTSPGTTRKTTRKR